MIKVNNIGNVRHYSIGHNLGLENAGVKMSKRGVHIGDTDTQTNIPNIYAIGDCTPGLKQIAKAVCEGAIAATTIIREGRK